MDEIINESIKERDLQPGDVIICSDHKEANEYIDALFEEGYSCFYRYVEADEKYKIIIAEKFDKLEEENEKRAPYRALVTLRDIQTQFASANKGEPFTSVILNYLDISAIQYAIEAITARCQEGGAEK